MRLLTATTLLWSTTWSPSTLLPSATRTTPSPSLFLDHNRVDGVDINEKDGWGRTPLHLLIEKRSDPMLTAWMVAQGADIPKDERVHNSTLLHLTFSPLTFSICVG